MGPPELLLVLGSYYSRSYWYDVYDRKSLCAHTIIASDKKPYRSSHKCAGMQAIITFLLAARLLA